MRYFCQSPIFFVFIVFFIGSAQARPIGNHWGGEVNQNSLNTSETNTQVESISLPAIEIVGNLHGPSNFSHGHSAHCGEEGCPSSVDPHHTSTTITKLTAKDYKNLLINALNSIDLSKIYNDQVQARMTDKILEHLFGLWGGPVGFMLDVMTPDENGLGTEPFDQKLSPEQMHQLRIKLEEDEQKTKNDPPITISPFRDPASETATQQAYGAMRNSALLKSEDVQIIIDQIIRRGTPEAPHPISKEVQKYAISIFSPIRVANICIVSKNKACWIPAGKMGQSCWCPSDFNNGSIVNGSSYRTLWTSTCKTPLGTCEIASQAPAGIDCYCSSTDPVIGPFIKGHAAIKKTMKDRI